MDSEKAVRSTIGADNLRLQPGRCIRLRGGDACAACEEACPVGLRPWDSDIRTSEQWEACTSCGACTSVCPTDALALGDAAWHRSYSAVAAEVSSRDLATSRTLKVACEQASDGSEDISVRCLAAFDAPLMLHAWAMGVGDIQLVDGRCQECRSGQVGVPSRASTQATAASRLANELDTSSGASVVPPPSAPTYEGEGEYLDRRGFFKWVRSRGMSVFLAVAEEQLPAETDIEGEAGACTPTVRRRVAVRAMRELLGQSAVAPSVGRGPLAMSVPQNNAEKCTGCGDCARFCPVGALRMEDENGRRRLSLTPALCIGCELCARLCRGKSISMDSPNLRALSAEPVLLAEGKLAECVKCGDQFMLMAKNTEPICLTCERSASRYSGFY